MTQPIGVRVQASVQVQRGTATHCACGGPLEGRCEPVDISGDAFVEKVPGRVTWRCADCGREYQ